VRKIKFVTHGFFGGQNSNQPGPVKEGWFHGFFHEGNVEGGIEPMAVVETLVGECIGVSVRQIKFESQPAESEFADGQALRTTNASQNSEA